MAGFLEALGLKKKKVDPKVEAGAAEYDAQRAREAEAAAPAPAKASVGLSEGMIDPSLTGAISAVKRRKATLEAI